MFPTESETDLWIALNRVQRSTSFAVDEKLKQSSLPNLRWYDVLWELERAGEAGLRPFELEKLLLFPQSNLSRVLLRMKKEKLIKEMVCGQDRRGKVLRITEAGIEKRNEIWSIYGPMIRKFIGHLSETHDLRSLTTALESMTDDKPEG